jgi:hypothetical protein
MENNKTSKEREKAYALKRKKRRYAVVDNRI